MTFATTREQHSAVLLLALPTAHLGRQRGASSSGSSRCPRNCVKCFCKDDRLLVVIRGSVLYEHAKTTIHTYTAVAGRCT